MTEVKAGGSTTSGSSAYGAPEGLKVPYRKRNKPLGKGRGDGVRDHNPRSVITETRDRRSAKTAFCDQRNSR